MLYVHVFPSVLHDLKHIHKYVLFHVMLLYVCVFCQGIVASGIVFSIQTWCIHKVGPVFVAIFQPLQMLLVAIMAFVILGDKLYSGWYEKKRELAKLALH